jgi:LmbE family N-acetylglucosaminyl deacetylase
MRRRGQGLIYFISMTPPSLRLALACVLCGTGSSMAAGVLPRQPSTAELMKRMDRLSVVGNVLYVGAHPDDENTRLLAYLAGDRLLRSAYLSITRGDGGQNLIGPEQGPLLGLIRTQELLAARRVDGAEQLFTRARDFGYSKTAQETLSIWDRDAVLADVVWVIRRFQPDAIITRFPTKGFDTHGHHTASAILAEQAFRAAADPRFRPEQLKWVAPWQAARLLQNKPIFPGLKPVKNLDRFLKLDDGGYSELLGQSWGEVAASARSMHKSQGFGVAPTRGPTLEYFEVVRGSSPRGKDPLGGLDFSWGRVKGSTRLVELIKKAQRGFEPRHPERSIPALLDARAELERLAPSPWKEQKLRELEELVAGCAGLFVSASAPDFSVVPGAALKLSLTALNRSPASLRLREVRLPGGVVVSVGKALAEHEPWQLERKALVAADAPISNPYWMQAPPREGAFVMPDQRLVGEPESPPALAVDFVVESGGRRLVLRRPVLYQWVDPVAGERSRAVEIAPAVTATPATSTLVFPDRKARPMRLLLRAFTDDARGAVRLDLPAGFTSQPARIPFSLAHKGDELEVSFAVRPPAAHGVAHGAARAVVELGKQQLSRALAGIDYPHIPMQVIFPEAAVTLSRFDLARKQLARPIGYIAGAGDDVPAALRAVDYKVTLLDDEALSHQPLGRFAAIVVGVRAYNTNLRMAFYHPRLMDYVKTGGVLLAQYSTSNRLSKVTAPIGPYPFTLSQDRVTDERAAVTLEAPAHPLLTRPNRITAADFDGWVQERGLYFAGSWSDKYETLLSMHDPGETPRRGSVLFARYGKGAFIYTGLAFFRELPAGVPGAYRLFANMIGYGK